MRHQHGERCNDPNQIEIVVSSIRGLGQQNSFQVDSTNGLPFADVSGPKPDGIACDLQYGDRLAPLTDAASSPADPIPILMSRPMR